MAQSLITKLMSALTSKATPAETDALIVGESNNDLKKITFSQLFTFLKDKLGINTLNTKTKWKMVGNTIGNTPIILPSDFEEIFIIVNVKADGITKSGCLSVPKIALSSDARYFPVGAYWTDANSYGIFFQINTASVSLQSYWNNHTEYINDTHVYVYYR